MFSGFSNKQATGDTCKDAFSGEVKNSHESELRREWEVHGNRTTDQNAERLYYEAEEGMRQCNYEET